MLGTSRAYQLRPSDGCLFSCCAAFAWFPTVCRGSAASGTSLPTAAVALGWPGGWGAAKGAGDSSLTSAEGWAMWVPGGSPDLYASHRGYLPVGEAHAEPPGRASSWGA
jgi:hypothetical protein